MISKLNILINSTKEKGLKYGIEMVTAFLIRSFTGVILRNRLLIEFCYGILPKARNLIPFHSSKVNDVNYPKRNDLMEKVREFWYANHPGDFDLGGEKISRKDIFIYGGPNPKFTCSVCQKSEWLSRVRQKNLFIFHNCSQSKECKDLCSKQGDELWTHYHQNFDFSIGCDSSLPAPKGVVMKLGKDRQEQFFNPCVAIAELVNRRRFAYASQIEGIDNPNRIIWSKYDFLYITMPPSVCVQKFTRPNIPIIMQGHDWWPLGMKHFQWMIDWLKPDIFLTMDPIPWKKRCKFPPSTKVILNPLFDSTFFARPNLREKKIDLLVIGATTSSSIYEGRIDLDKKISGLASRYKIEFSHSSGAGNVASKNSVLGKDSRSGSPMRFLNKWSEYLGSARYVIFGRMKYPVLTMKHYEVLGSGAVPIFPEVPDLIYLGIKPFKHYIPLSEVEGDEGKLTHYLDNYEKFRSIAENAVKWYKENSDKMLFGDFEGMIREVTDYKYPERLI